MSLDAERAAKMFINDQQNDSDIVAVLKIQTDIDEHTSSRGCITRVIRKADFIQVYTENLVLNANRPYCI